MVFELERNSKALEPPCVFLPGFRPGSWPGRALGGKVLRRKGAEGGAGSLREELLGLMLLPG